MSDLIFIGFLRLQQEFLFWLQFVATCCNNTLTSKTNNKRFYKVDNLISDSFCC